MQVPQLLKTSPNYAVVINANAGRVTNDLTSALREIVPKNRLFLTKSQLHARDVIEYCVEQNMDAVFAGGGDGTDSTNTIAGRGATMIGTFSLTEGTVLKILVGQKGGDAFVDSCAHQNRAGGGGGGTLGGGSGGRGLFPPEMADEDD